MADDNQLRTAFARQMQMLNVERSAALADLEAHQANGETDSAATVIQRIADLDAAARNLNDLGNRYVQSQTLVQAPPASQEERAARPFDRMD